jgi:hypothetical protein
MKVPIPSDWNGEDWRCIQVQFPDSPEWSGLLVGLLTLLTRGRYWDEDTGRIVDAQKIAWEIFNRAYPFVSCDGGDIPCPEPETIFCYSGSDEDEEDEMAGCTLPYGSIKVIDGVLSYKTCDGFVPVEGFAELITDPPIDPPIVDEDTDYGCNKAHGMSTVFTPDLKLGVVAMAAVGANLRASVLRTTLPQHNISWAEALSVAQYFDLDISGNTDLATDDDLLQKLACAWSPGLLDTSTLTEAEYLGLQNLTKSQYAIAQANFINAMVYALGYSPFSYWANIYHDTVADCDCPEEPPSASQIFFIGASSVGGANNTTLIEATVKDGGRRMLIDIEADSGSGSRSMTDLDLTLAGADTGDYIGFRVYEYSADPGIGMLTADWKEYTDAPEADWFEAVGLGGISTSRSNESGYVDFDTADNPAANLTHIRCEDLRFYPFTGSFPTRNSRFYVEITSVNGVELTPIGP